MTDCLNRLFSFIHIQPSHHHISDNLLTTMFVFSHEHGNNMDFDYMDYATQMFEQYSRLKPLQ